jgi:hypothetical protein
VEVVLLASSLNDIVLFCNSNLQGLKIMVLVDMDVLMEDIFALTNQVEAFDRHDELALCFFGASKRQTLVFLISMRIWREESQSVQCFATNNRCASDVF